MVSYLIAADSVLCGGWVVYGVPYGLRFPTVWDSNAFHNCSGGSLHAAGSSFEQIINISIPYLIAFIGNTSSSLCTNALETHEFQGLCRVSLCLRALQRPFFLCVMRLNGLKLNLQEGTSNYFKGLMLILCYIIVAASFFVHRDPKAIREFSPP